MSKIHTRERAAHSTVTPDAEQSVEAPRRGISKKAKLIAGIGTAVVIAGGIGIAEAGGSNKPPVAEQPNTPHKDPKKLAEALIADMTYNKPDDAYALLDPELSHIGKAKFAEEISEASKYLDVRNAYPQIQLSQVPAPVLKSETSIVLPQDEFPGTANLHAEELKYRTEGTDANYDWRIRVVEHGSTWTVADEMSTSTDAQLNDK